MPCTFATRSWATRGFENTQQTLWLYAEWKAYVVAAFRGSVAGHGWSPSAWGTLAWTVMSFSAKVSMANGLDFAFTWPLELLFGFPGYYNAKCILILATNGLALFILARGLGCRALPSWVGGAVFAFNPFAFYLLLTGRVIECILFPMPLFALCLWRAWHEQEGLRWAVGAGAMLGLATLLFWFHGHFLLVFAFVFVAWQGACGLKGLSRDSWRQVRWSRAAHLGIMALVGLILVMPAAMPYLVLLERGQRVPGEARGSSDDEKQRYITQVLNWSCDAEYGILPVQSSDEPGRRWNPPWQLPTIHTFDGVLALGVILCLAFVRPGYRFWSVACLLLYLLPMGPVLKRGGELVHWGSQPVRLPFYWVVEWLPLADHLLFPAVAMGTWIMVAAAVVALGLDRCADRRPRLACGLGIVLLVGAAWHMVALTQLPFATTPVSLPAVYQGSARGDDAEGFVYLPANLKFWDDARSFNREFYVEPDLKHVDFHAAAHGRKCLWGRNQYLAGKDIWMFQPPTALANSYLRHLVYLDREAGDYTAPDRRQVREAGFRYVVVLERLCSHRFREGDYTLDLAAGEKLYETLRERLAARHGPPIHEGPDPSWEKYIRPGTVTLHSYRMCIFDLDAGDPKAGR